MPKLCSRCQKNPTRYEDSATCAECNEKEFEEEERGVRESLKEKFGQEIKEKVQGVWGNPSKVARVVFGVMLHYADELGGDYDDQINAALEVGVLAGEMRGGTADEFMEALTRKIFDDES